MSVPSDQSIDDSLPVQPERARLSQKKWWTIVFGRREVILLLINLAFILGMTLLTVSAETAGPDDKCKPKDCHNQ